jgi:CRP-like cAMP-binding protein
LIKSAKDLFDPGAFLAKVGAGKSISELQKGDIVFAQGDVADTVFYIQKGKIKLVVVSEEGKEAIVGILESGQFFGEGCLNGRRFRVATTVALEVSVVTRISKEAMTRMLEIEPKFAQLFMMHLISRNSRIEEDLVDQLFNPSEKRLARVLLLLANSGKEAHPIDIDVNQETLAEMIGATRSRVSFFMNKFKRLGFISYNGTIRVHASLLNAILHDKSAIATQGEPDLCGDSNSRSQSSQREASSRVPSGQNDGR